MKSGRSSGWRGRILTRVALLGLSIGGLPSCPASKVSTKPLPPESGRAHEEKVTDGASTGSAPARPLDSAGDEPRPPSTLSTPLPIDPPADNMVLVPAGSFWMGCAKKDRACREDEKPRHLVELDAFKIDVYEVTVSDYMRCARGEKCDSPENYRSTRSGICNAIATGRDQHPMNCIARADASNYCQWTGKRLPTEAEWERAARGTDDRIYPWEGDARDLSACVGSIDTCSVGSHPTGVSPVGAHDMAGNVAEWTTDLYHPRYYGMSPRKNPEGFTGIQSVMSTPCGEAGCPVVRGGSYGDDLAHVRATSREGHNPWSSYHVGFRCVRTGG